MSLDAIDLQLAYAEQMIDKFPVVPPIWAAVAFRDHRYPNALMPSADQILEIVSKGGSPAKLIHSWITPSSNYGEQTLVWFTAEHATQSQVDDLQIQFNLISNYCMGIIPTIPIDVLNRLRIPRHPIDQPATWTELVIDLAIDYPNYFNSHPPYKTYWLTGPDCVDRIELTLTYIYNLNIGSRAEHAGIVFFDVCDSLNLILLSKLSIRLIQATLRPTLIEELDWINKVNLLKSDFDQWSKLLAEVGSGKLDRPVVGYAVSMLNRTEAPPLERWGELSESLPISKYYLVSDSAESQEFIILSGRGIEKFKTLAGHAGSLFPELPPTPYPEIFRESGLPKSNNYVSCSDDSNVNLDFNSHPLASLKILLIGQFGTSRANTDLRDDIARWLAIVFTVLKTHSPDKVIHQTRNASPGSDQNHQILGLSNLNLFEASRIVCDLLISPPDLSGGSNLDNLGEKINPIPANKLSPEDVLILTCLYERKAVNDTTRLTRDEIKRDLKKKLKGDIRKVLSRMCRRELIKSKEGNRGGYHLLSAGKVLLEQMRSSSNGAGT